MRRRKLFTLEAGGLLNIAGVISLLLGVTMSAVWWRSYAWSDYLGWCNAGGWREVYSNRGRLVVNLMLGDYSQSAQQFQPPTYRREDVMQRTPPDLLGGVKELGVEQDDT